MRGQSMLIPLLSNLSPNCISDEPLGCYQDDRLVLRIPFLLTAYGPEQHHGYP